MALTKVAGDILDPGISVAGVVTATAFDGPFRGGSDSDIIAGIGTFTELDVNGNADFSGNVTIGGSFTVQGDYTTLNTTLRNVELLRVSAASTFPAGIVTQTGTGDILNLFDGTTEVFTVLDGGNVGIGSDSPTDKLNILTGSSDEVTSFKVKTSGQLELSRNHSDAPFIKTFMSSGNPEIRLGDSGGTKTIIHGHGISYFNGGNVGIGETEPDKDLHISQSGTSAATIRLTDTDTSATTGHGIGLIEFETLDSTDPGVNASIGAYHNDVAGNSNLQFHTGNAGSTTAALKIFPDQASFFYGGVYQTKEDTSTTWASRGNPLNFNNNQHGITARNASGTDGCFTGFSGVAFNANSPARWQTASFLVKSVAGTGYTPEIHVTQRTDNTETSTALVIDTSQRVLLGHTSSIEPDNYASSLQVTGTNTAAGISILRYGDNSAGPTLLFGKSRGANIGGFDKVDDGDNLGKIEFYGTDTGWESSASVRACADGDWYSSSDDTDSPGRLEFHTTPNGADQLQERLRIDSSGHILPGDAGTQNLGSATKEWADLYFANSKGLKLGSGQVGDLYNDGTDTYFRNSVSNGQTLIRSGGNIWISDYAGNHRAAFRDNSAVDLYFDIENHATAKLSTTATGVSVHGEVAASQDYPNYRPRIDWNFAKVKKLDPRITFSRLGPASYVDTNGYVKLVDENEPRFDHDPLTGECKGLLMEQNVVNWIKWSSKLDVDGQWYQNGTTNVLAPDVVGPDGKTGNVYEVFENATNGYHATYYASSIPVNNGTKYSVSSWIKKGPNYRTDQASGKFELYTRRSGSGAYASIKINSAFTAIDTINNVDSSFIEQYRNGWVRVGYTFTADGTSSNIIPHWLHAQGQSYMGNGASSVYIWGCQFESMPFPTSYIPSAGDYNYRNEDIAVIDGTEFSEFFNPDEGTSVVHAHLPVSNGASGLPSYTFKNSAVSAVTLGLSRDDNASPAYHYYNDGSNSGFTRASATGDNMYKGAMSFKTSDFDSYVNGSANTNTTTFTMPTIDNLRIGGIGGANQAGGHVARFMYYPVKLTNNQLATLTS